MLAVLSPIIATSVPGICDASRPLLAISSCLLGRPVRYDGAHKLDALVAEVLGNQVDWFAICPEVEIGLGVPRPPIHLVGEADQLRAVRVADAGLDVSSRLRGFARQQVEQLTGVSGYIFKSRSPSCGLDDVTWTDSSGRSAGVASGLYAAVIRERLPALPVIDERAFRDVETRERFLRAVFALHEQRGGRG